MNIIQNNYLNYKIPLNWVVQENVDITTIYNNNGEGALTMSYYTITKLQGTLDEHIIIMAKKFIDKNKIKLHRPLVLDGTKKEKTVLYGTGNAPDNWFLKIWVVTKYPKIVLATYQSQIKTSEIKQIDAMVNSFRFDI